MDKHELKLQQTAVFSTHNYKSVKPLGGDYVCYICLKEFDKKGAFDSHFQQAIPRHTERKHDKSVIELHFSGLKEFTTDTRFLLSVSIRRGIVPNSNILIFRNVAFNGAITITHMYMFNSESHSHFNSKSILMQANAEHQVTLTLGCVALCEKNVLAVQILSNNNAYWEIHEIGNQCCIRQKRYFRFDLQKRVVDMKLYGKMKADALRKQIPEKANDDRRSSLTPANYTERLSKASQIEQVHRMLQLESYRRTITIRAEQIKNNTKLTLEIENVEDMLPYLTINDSIRITQNGSTQVNETIKTKKIKLDVDSIVGDFKFIIKPGRYDVEFILCTYSFDIEAHVLHRTRSLDVIRFMFPNGDKENLPHMDKSSTRGTVISSLKWCDKQIEKNPIQRQAVCHIVAGTAYPHPYVVYGPPGTGKTQTLVEAIYQIVTIDTHSKLLVCANSNAAADELALRLNRVLHNTCPFDHQVYRLYGKAYYNVSKVNPELLSCSNYCLGRCPDITTLKQYRIIIGTLLGAGSLFMGTIAPKFSHIFIDECGAATESATLVPLFNAFGAGKINANIVLAGDPRQLGPVIYSKASIEMGYDISLLERLLGATTYSKHPSTKRYDPHYITKLTINYRSHSAIISPSNIMFYEQELRAHGTNKTTCCYLNWNRLPNRSYPVIFHAMTKTWAENENQSLSLFNRMEVQQIRYFVEVLLKKGINGMQISQMDIGIITPYKKQCKKLKSAMENRNWNDIMVGSVEMFQGKEKPIILVSTVRSGRMGIGFLNNQKRLNVMLTRAKALMIIVGNPLVLQKDGHWSEMLRIYYEAGVLAGDCVYFSLDACNKTVHLAKRLKNVIIR